MTKNLEEENKRLINMLSVIEESTKWTTFLTEEDIDNIITNKITQEMMNELSYRLSYDNYTTDLEKKMLALSVISDIISYMDLQSYLYENESDIDDYDDEYDISEEYFSESNLKDILSLGMRIKYCLMDAFEKFILSYKEVGLNENDGGK